MCWPSGKEARIPARVFRASAPQASDAVIADFMSHLLPENNWSELNILNSVSKAFIKTRGYGLEFRVRPGLEFRLPAANINSICHHLKGRENVAYLAELLGGYRVACAKCSRKFSYYYYPHQTLSSFPYFLIHP